MNWNDFTTGFDAWVATPASKLFSGFLSAGSWAMGGIASGASYLWNSGAGTAMLNGLQSFGGYIGDGFVWAYKGAGSLVSSAMSSASNAEEKMDNAQTAIIADVKEDVSSAETVVQADFANAKQAVGDAVSSAELSAQKMLSNVEAYLSTLKAGVVADASILLNMIRNPEATEQQVASAVTEEVKSEESAAQQALAKVQAYLSNVKGDLVADKAAFLTMVENAMSSAKQAATNAVSTVTAGVKSEASEVEQALVNMQAYLSNVANIAETDAVNLLNMLKNPEVTEQQVASAVTEEVKSEESSAQQVLAKVQAYLSNVKGDLVADKAAFLTMVENTMSSAKQAATNAVSTVTAGVKSEASEAEQALVNMKAYLSNVANIAETDAVNLLNMLKNPEATEQQVASAVTDEVKSEENSVQQAFENMEASLLNAKNNLVNGVESVIQVVKHPVVAMESVATSVEQDITDEANEIYANAAAFLANMKADFNTAKDDVAYVVMHPVAAMQTAAENVEDYVEARVDAAGNVVVDKVHTIEAIPSQIAAEMRYLMGDSDDVVSNTTQG